MISNSSLYHLFAVGSGLFWLFTYIIVIWRGFQDKSFGMPVIALSANASWEAIYSFFYIPPSELLHYSSIVWLLFDIPILIQCFLYGAEDFKAPLIKNNFIPILGFSIFISFWVLLCFVRELNDVRGVYSGFGINLMMSTLYIGMFIRRGGNRGQSVYIALFKALGTLCAFLSLFFPLPLAETEVPVGLSILLTRLLTEQIYPLTPLIKILYFSIFILDIGYILLLSQKQLENQI
jgi:hypothetical protein